MSEQRASLEVIAPTVEQAIAQGLADLGLPKEAVEIEVLDSGTRGILGLGSRQCRVRLTVKAVPESDTPSLAPELQGIEQPSSPLFSQPQPDQNMFPEDKFKPLVTPQESAGEEPDTVLRVTQQVVSTLMEKMKVRAKVVVSYGEKDTTQSRAPVLVDIRGDDLSFLIGPRAETLNALQYVAGLIIGKELGHSIRLLIDVEGYRARRAQQIRHLARRMADQAIKTGRRQVLEPMPASERRLIHIELRNHPQVTTESVGEEPRRKVTILPRRTS